MTSTGPEPGTYRVSDKSRVEFRAALLTWVPLAHQALRTTASRYGSVMTYLELAEQVQDASGIRTRMLLTNWIGKLLEEVALLAKTLDEPPLTSLCVHQDGTIGPGYARAPKSVTDEPGEDIEYHAAQHRLLCYQRYAQDLPADGGQPMLTPAEDARRSRRAAQDRDSRPRALCPDCFTELPASGKCDYCAS